MSLKRLALCPICGETHEIIKANRQRNRDYILCGALRVYGFEPATVDSYTCVREKDGAGRAGVVGSAEAGGAGAPGPADATVGD